MKKKNIIDCFNRDAEDADEFFTTETQPTVQEATVYRKQQQYYYAAPKNSDNVFGDEDTTNNVATRKSMRSGMLYSHIQAKTGVMAAMEKIPNLLSKDDSNQDKIKQLDKHLNAMWKRSSIAHFNKGMYREAMWYPTVYAFVSWNEQENCIRLQKINEWEARPDPKAREIKDSNFFIIKKATAKNVILDSIVPFLNDENDKEKVKKNINKLKNSMEDGSAVGGDLPNQDITDSDATGRDDKYVWYMYFKKKDDGIYLSFHANKYGKPNGNKTETQLLYKVEQKISTTFPIVAYKYQDNTTKINGVSLFELGISTQKYIDNINLKIYNYLNDFTGSKYIIDSASDTSASLFKKFIVNSAKKVMSMKSSGGGQMPQTAHLLNNPEIPKTLLEEEMRAVANLSAITGIDEAIAATDTGSITTTGGVMQIMNKKGLIDSVLTIPMERYLKQLTKLIIELFIENYEGESAPTETSEIIGQDTSAEPLGFESIMSDTEVKDEDMVVGQNKFKGIEYDLIIELADNTPSAKAQQQQLMLELVKMDAQASNGGGLMLHALEFLFPNEKRFAGRVEEYMRQQQAQQQQQEQQAAQQQQMAQLAQADLNNQANLTGQQMQIDANQEGGEAPNPEELGAMLAQQGEGGAPAEGGIPNPEELAQIVAQQEGEITE